MILRPTGDLVFVKPDVQPTRSEGGLHLVYDRQQSTMRGRVVALGEGPRSRGGTLMPHHVAINDAVVFSPDAGEELHFEHDLLVCLPEDDILAVIQ